MARMSLLPESLRTFFLFLIFCGPQVLATEVSITEEVVDVKYAVIGTLLGVIISASFLVVKICMMRKHMFDNEIEDPRRNPNRDGQMIEV
ncbi:transmembrane protein 273 isoform X2 [Ornithorhynchus anatinus]|uniref:transmembrane protein 273 isoform X2 n=1 Tax=Ornithorhynchus anatinus TaxID=9258 RepID=UPI0019D4D48A|nr:transmembrane protein 273 isoform X2 [Ornithorhynchus anatinus]